MKQKDHPSSVSSVNADTARRLSVKKRLLSSPRRFNKTSVAKKSFFGSTKMWAVFGLVLGASFAAMGQGHGQALAGACPAATSDLGTDTITVNVPAQATYTVWTRMKAPDTTHNSINLQVDQSNCYAVGGGSFTATAWNNSTSNWVNYSDGAPSNVISLNLAAGNHTLKYIGTQAGVEVDVVLLSSDPSCVPTGTGGCPSGDSTPPTVSLTSPTANQQVTGLLNMAATASDASGIMQVQFLVDGTPVNTATSSPYTYSWNSASVANGTHKVKAVATDTAGNSGTSSEVTITVNNTVSCTGNPSVPTNLRVTATTPSSVSLAWNASTPASACTIQGYKIYRGGTQITTAPGTSYTESGLAPNTQYSYTIAAVDTSGHTSAQTAAVSASTTADSQAPTVPTNLRTTMTTSNSVSIAWDASTDNNGVAGYDVFRNGTKVGSPTATAYTDSGLAPNTTYSYTVKARDAAGNSSAASVALSAKTLNGSAASTGDMNGDGKVNITDLSILLSHWNATGVPVTQGDLNGSGKVDIIDLSILLSHWG